MKKLSALLFAFLLLFSLCFPCAALTVTDWHETGGASLQSLAEKPLVVDNADVFTEEQEAALTAAAERISAEYAIGYVFLTDIDNHSLSQDVYAADFLYYGGYGIGENNSATVFYLSLETGNRGWRTISIGDCMNTFTESVVYALDDAVEDDIKAGNYYAAFCTHADFTEKLLAGGTVPTDYASPTASTAALTDLQTVGIGIGLALAVGIISGICYLSALKKKMRIVPPVDARGYLVNNSYELRDRRVWYLYSTVVRTARPKNNDSGSSFGSGSASGGGSFSGGGRNF